MGTDNFSFVLNVISLQWRLYVYLILACFEFIIFKLKLKKFLIKFKEINELKIGYVLDDRDC